MAIPQAQIMQLKAFVSVLKAQPAMLHHPELGFLRDYLESLGATLPPKPEAAKAEEGKCPMKEDIPAPPEPEEEEVEEEPMSEESDVDLDMEGVVEADKEDPVSMGDPKKELGEDDFDKFDAKKSEAMGVFSEDPASACCVAYSQKAQKKNSGRFLKFLKMIEIPWLMQDNDLPFSDITELSDYGICYQCKVNENY